MRRHEGLNELPFGISHIGRVAVLAGSQRDGQIGLHRDAATYGSTRRAAQDGLGVRGAHQ